MSNLLKSFSNGKVLGGHMRAHCAFHPLSPKPQELEYLNKTNPSMPLRSREGKDQDNSCNKYTGEVNWETTETTQINRCSG